MLIIRAPAEVPPRSRLLGCFLSKSRNRGAAPPGAENRKIPMEIIKDFALFALKNAQNARSFPQMRPTTSRSRVNTNANFRSKRFALRHFFAPVRKNAFSRSKHRVCPQKKKLPPLKRVQAPALQAHSTRGISDVLYPPVFSRAINTNKAKTGEVFTFRSASRFEAHFPIAIWKVSAFW